METQVPGEKPLHAKLRTDYFNDALAYFGMVVSYARKCFIKLTLGANVIKLFCP